MSKQSVAVAACVLVMILLAGRSRAQGETPGQNKQNQVAPDRQKRIVAVFSLDGPILERAEADELLFGSLNAESLNDLVKRMNQAAADNDVRAVVILLGNTSFGPGQIEELRASMKNLQAHGKQVYAHADALGMHSYVLLSGASKLSVAPNGDLWINGLYGESLYIRGLLDKLGVQPDFVTCGAYKSAAEMFMRKGPSPEAAEMYDWVFSSIFDTYLQLVAAGRGVTKAEVRRWVDQGLYTAEKAARIGIIDAAEYRDDFVRRLKKQYGDNVRFNKSYAEKQGPQIDLANPFAAFQIWGELFFGRRERRPSKDVVAIVYVDGPILPGKPGTSPFGLTEAAYSDPIRRALDKLADDEQVKAVVLRVDSPGGSAVASEIILEATKRVKKKKPLVVSMGNVAGSGGYYVACGADTIFADATTITASIGVVAGKLATSGMWGKIGIHWDPIQKGKNADMLSSAKVFTDQQRQRLLAWMGEIYEVFKGHVRASRGDRLKKPLEDLAGGRIFTGKQARDLGLVDRIGGLDDAIRYVAQQAGIEDYELRVAPRPKSALERLLGDLARQKEDEDDRRLSLRSAGARAGATLPDTALRLLQGVDARRIQGVRQALLLLELLQNEHILMTMPVIQFPD